MPYTESLLPKNDFTLYIQQITSKTESRFLSDPEKQGIFLICISTLIQTFNSFYIKIIQVSYPNHFHTIPFLFFRSLTIILLSLIRAFYSKERILSLKEIPEKKWFFYRTNINFFGLVCFTLSLWYLRSSTAQILNSLSPALVLILSYFILQEQLYFRYIIGFILCVLGSSIIVLNEHHANNQVTDHSISHTVKGVIFGLIAVFTVSLLNISNKILAMNKVPINTQMFYAGISTCIYSSLYNAFCGLGELSLGYVLICMSHGIGFFIGNILYNMALQNAPLSKLIIWTYLRIVYIFILAFVFLHESIFMSDLIGTGIILLYMCYNAYYPLPIQAL